MEPCILRNHFHQALVSISLSVITLERLHNLPRSLFSRAVCDIEFFFIELVFSFSLGSTSCVNATAAGSNAPAASTGASTPTTGAGATTGTTASSSKTAASSSGSSYVSHDYPRLHN